MKYGSVRYSANFHCAQNHCACTVHMAPKKKADDKPAIFAAIDKGDDDTLQELLSADPGIVNLRNKVFIRSPDPRPAALA